MENQSVWANRKVGKVEVSMRARRIFNVDTVNETFGALLHFICRWEMPSW